MHRHTRQLVAVALLGLCVAAPAAEEPRPNQLAHSLQDFFKQPEGKGSLVGGLIGGALTAHPLGLLLGGAIGYFGTHELNAWQAGQHTTTAAASAQPAPKTPHTAATGAPGTTSPRPATAPRAAMAGSTMGGGGGNVPTPDQVAGGPTIPPPPVLPAPPPVELPKPRLPQQVVQAEFDPSRDCYGGRHGKPRAMLGAQAGKADKGDELPGEYLRRLDPRCFYFSE